jgi:arylsulfatase A-like enzyme
MIVVFLSDNGEMQGHNGLFFKICLYEPATRDYCIIRYDGVIKKSQFVDEITELIDVMPKIIPGLAKFVKVLKKY